MKPAQPKQSPEKLLALVEELSASVGTVMLLSLTVPSLVRAARLRRKPRKPTPDEKNIARWQAVYSAHFSEGLPWLKAYEKASERLAHTPFATTPRTMKWSYAEVQRIRRNSGLGQ